MPLTFIDLFAGCGGLSLGLMQAGLKGRFAVEKDPMAFATLSANLISGARHQFDWPCWLPKEPLRIEQLLKRHADGLDELAGTVDLLAGGPPCQGFSSIGRRQPDDARNQMFRHYIEVVRRVRPRFVLLENVQGIRFPFGKHSEKDGTTGMRYSERIKTALEEDYQVFEDVIDAEGFGVPQRRVRYILVGVRRDDGRRESCPDPFQILSNMRGSFVRERKLSQLMVSVRDAIGDLRRSRLRTIESPDSPGFMHGRHQAPKSAYQRLMHARPAGTPADSHRFARHTPEVREKFLWFLKNCSKGKKLSAEDRGAYANRKHTVHVLHPAFAALIAKVENMGPDRSGLEFAPSVHVVQKVLENAEFAAISSSSVDPACFLGGWLPNSYLWDYQLPTYAQRSGDTNGYYLLSTVKERDCDSVSSTLRRLLGEQVFSSDQVSAIIHEVCRRGIPTVRGLSAGDHGASGDLGLLIACRLLQDGFRTRDTVDGLLPLLAEDGVREVIALILPVDPFKGYIDDLRRSAGLDSRKRPDLLVAGISLASGDCRIRLTPIEVKFRADGLNLDGKHEALAQARSLSDLLNELAKWANDPGLVMWKIAFQHLLATTLGFGFRVYSQQQLAARQSSNWARIHSTVVAGILGDEARIEIDPVGRSIVVGTTASGPDDIDHDGFNETVSISTADAAAILQDDVAPVVASVRKALGYWRLIPAEEPRTAANEATSVQSSPYVPGVSPDLEDRSRAEEPPLQAPQHPEPPQVYRNGIEFIVGHTVDAFTNEPRWFIPSDTRVNQLNIGVVGDLGTGKTQFLKAMILNLSRSAAANRGIRPRILIFDYKKDYTSDDFVSAVDARVVQPKHLPLNLFDTRDLTDSMSPVIDRFNFFADVLGKIYSNVGHVQRKKLKTAVKAAYESTAHTEWPPTIYHVREQYEKILEGGADSPSSILDDIVDRELFVQEASSAIPFGQFLNGVVVVNLAALGQDDSAKHMVVAILLNMFYEHMLKIEKRPFIGSDPQLRVVDSFLLVDEADNIMQYEFDVLRRLLLQGREFGVGVILASQYLSHFKAGSTDYREMLLSWFVHKVPNIVAHDIQVLGVTAQAAELAERVKALSNHWCMYKSHTGSAEIVHGLPFYQLKGSGPS